MNNFLQTFPSPVATYEEVVANEELFMTTLKKLHSDLGTKFWIPNVRVRPLDLHKLFVEVTSRGGIEQAYNRWREVIDTFNFSKSYQTNIMRNTVRKYYYSLLHNYEIIYYFKARNQLPPLIGFVHERLESGYLPKFLILTTSQVHLLCYDFLIGFQKRGTKIQIPSSLIETTLWTTTI